MAQPGVDGALIVGDKFSRTVQSSPAQAALPPQTAAAPIAAAPPAPLAASSPATESLVSRRLVKRAQAEWNARQFSSDWWVNSAGNAYNANARYDYM